MKIAEDVKIFCLNLLLLPEQISAPFARKLVDYRQRTLRLWYLSLRRPAKAQASLRICAVSPEPSLFAHMKYGSSRRVWPKIRHLAAHVHLKKEFMEDEKCHNLSRWLNFFAAPKLGKKFERSKSTLVSLASVSMLKLHHFTTCKETFKKYIMLT